MTKLLVPVITAYISLLWAGATGYEFRPGLKIDAPIITPTNPELR